MNAFFHLQTASMIRRPLCLLPSAAPTLRRPLSLLPAAVPALRRPLCLLLLAVALTACGNRSARRAASAGSVSETPAAAAAGSAAGRGGDAGVVGAALSSAAGDGAGAVSGAAGAGRGAAGAASGGAGAGQGAANAGRGAADVVVASGVGSGAAGAAAGSGVAGAVAGSGAAGGSAAQPDELPLPEIPAALRDPRQRAAYLVAHFWDALDFRDTRRTRDEAFMEQQFVDWIALFPHADTTALFPAVADLLDRAEPASDLWFSLTGLAEKYLYDPNSPMLDEAAYTLFLRAVLATPGLDDACRIRPRAQLAEIALNRPGTLAPDFAWLRPDGSTGSLHDVRADRLLLFFYDAECAQCAAEIDWLEHDPAIAAQCAAGRLAIAAICVDGTPEAWRRKLPTLSDRWIIGYAAGDRYPEGRYVLRAVPSFYLLDADKRVLLKDAPPALVARTLAGTAAGR